METKTFVRTLYGKEDYAEGMRETIREKLNKLGFYVLTGAGDSLVVYTLSEETTWTEQVIAFLIRISRNLVRKFK